MRQPIAFALCCVLGAPLAGCSSNATEEASAGGPGAIDAGAGDATPPSNGGRWPACDATATTQRVSFVHMNDMHGHYNQTPNGGPANVARIRGLFESVQRDNPFTLFTNGGDDYEKGSVAEPISQYQSTREVSAALDFDVRVIGNHDFAWSQAQLLEYTRGDRAIVLASNIKYIGSDPQKYGAVQYAELTVGCVKIGFMGAVSGPWDDENNPLSADYYKEFPTDLDFVKVHRDLIAEHRKDVDLLVAISHLGVGDDAVVAAQAPGLDFILGGHSHTVMFNPEVVGGTAIVQAGSYGGFAAHLDVDVDLQSRKVSGYKYELTPASLIPVASTSDVAEKRVEAILDKYAPHAFEPIARAKNVTHAIDAARFATEGAKLALQVDAAAMKTSAVFNSVKAGPLSEQDLFDVFLIERQPPGTPGWTSTWTASMTGADLRKLDGLSPTEWAWLLPATIDDAKSYVVSLPRFAATHPEKYLPAGVVLGDVKFAAETWELLEEQAKARTQGCRYLDVDEPLPGCAP